MSSHEGKVAIVTGAARGIGRGVALRLARAGADVAIIDIDLDGAKVWGEELTAASVPDEIRALGRRSAAVQADLGDFAAAQEAVRKLIAEMGGVHFLVNVAGGGITPMETSQAATTSSEDMEKLFAANYKSAVACSQAVLPMMREQRFGSIVNITAQSGCFAPPMGFLAHYGAAKAAVNHFTRSLAGQVGPDGVRVNAVSPGFVATARISGQKMTGESASSFEQGVPLRRLGTPDDIAKAVEFLTSDLSDYITGQVLAVNGGSTLGPC